MNTNFSELIAKSPTALLMMILFLSCTATVNAQNDDPPRYEVGAEFSTISREDFTSIRTELGVGGRFTLNLNKYVAFDSAAYFFPRSCFDCPNNGRVTEVVAGVKVGKRFEKWGLFAKARPGIVSFSKGQVDVSPTFTPSAFPFVFQVKPLTNFATDIGGVLEFYPTRRIVTRFDAGNTIVFIREQTRNAIQFDPVTNTFTLFPFTLPGKTTHNFQFSAGVGYRW